MRTLRLLLHDDCGQPARRAVARDVAAALHARVAGIDLAPPALVDGCEGSSAGSMLLAHERTSEPVCAQPTTGIAADLRGRDPAGAVAAALADQAAMTDLIVLNTPLHDDAVPDMVEVIGRLVHQARSPILAVPPDASGFRITGNAIVLWDGSADAETALRAAVPLLLQAGMVTILHVDDGDTLPTPLRSASDYLRSHGIDAHHTMWAKFGTAVQTIERYVARHHPAYVVMGAVGHGARPAVLLGSVTRHMLSAGGVPILLASRG